MLTTLKKYLHLFLSFFRLSLMADLEYRLNIVIKVIGDICWYIAQLSLFEVLYLHTQSIHGWTLSHVRVFMGVLFLVDALWMTIFSENFDRLSWKIRRGELDLLLAKPINSQFMITLQKQNTSYVVNVMLTLAYIIWGVSQLPFTVSVFQWFLLIMAVPCGLAVLYSMRLFFALMSVIFTNAESMNYVFYQIYRLGMRPDALYPKWLRLLILTFLPVGFVASVPARLLLNGPLLPLALFPPLLAVTLIYLSHRFWKYALSFYTSTS